MCRLIVGFISKPQRRMSDAASKEARKGNFDLKKQVRHIGNVFLNSVEVSAQEAVYLDLQIPLTFVLKILFLSIPPPRKKESSS